MQRFKYVFIEVNDLLDGGLQNLEPGYDPCPELARLLPNCDVVRKCKGGEFVNSIQQQEELANWQNKTHLFIYACHLYLEGSVTLL